MGHFVYKYVYKSEVIYIGKNDTNLIDRIRQHGKFGDNIPEEGWDEINSSDIYYIELANSIMSDVVESELIRRYKPKYNKAKKSEWQGINFPEPVWIKFDKNNEVYKNCINAENDSLHRQNAALMKIIEKRDNTIEELIDKNYKLGKINDFWENKFKAYLELKDNNIPDPKVGITFEDIIDIYKNTNDIVDYICETYDKFGNLVAYKRIYVNEYDHLCFDFQQLGTLNRHGCIFYNRTQDTKANWNVLRTWMNRGGNRYFVA